jgi:hypothetical protein
MLNKPRNLDDLGAYTNNTRSDERIWLCSIYCTYFIHFDGRIDATSRHGADSSDEYILFHAIFYRGFLYCGLVVNTRPNSGWYK